MKSLGVLRELFWTTSGQHAGTQEKGIRKKTAARKHFGQRPYSSAIIQITNHLRQPFYLLADAGSYSKMGI
jgi:hypothetical protein